VAIARGNDKQSHTDPGDLREYISMVCFIDPLSLYDKLLSELAKLDELARVCKDKTFTRVFTTALWPFADNDIVVGSPRRRAEYGKVHLRKTSIGI
jgi:hypothetical protein